MRAELEAMRDAMFNSVDLADLTTSQVISVGDKVTAMIDKAEELCQSEPAAVVEVASLAVIDMRVAEWMQRMQKEVTRKLRRKA